MYETIAETPREILPQLCSPMADDEIAMSDYRYRGYLYNLREPRYPVTGPIGFKEVARTYPLKSSLVKGKPVLPPNPGNGFLHGSPTVGKFSETDRKEQKQNIRLMEKTSAELRKLERQQYERQQFTEEHQEAKNFQNIQKAQEKMEDLKLLKTYNPFGRPGFGAPRGHDKNSLMMTKALQSKDGVGIVQENTTLQIPRQFPKNRVQRYEDDRMRRYRVDKKTAKKYKQELDALIDVKKQQAKVIDGIEKHREDQMIGYDPFGKPGAGAPNIDDSGGLSTRRSVSLSYVNHPMDAVNLEKRAKLRSRNRTGNIMMFRKHRFASPEKVHEAQKQIGENPWLKLGQPPKREKIRFPRAGDHGIYEFVDADLEDDQFSRKHVGGGGEPLLDKSGEIRTKRAGLLTTIHGARRTENITKVATPEDVRDSRKLSPWGKPGAGAPLKDSDGQIVKNTKGRIQYESMGYSKREEENMELAKKIYRDDLQKGIEQQRQIRDEEKGYMRLPPGDVPSWFSKGQVGRPKRDPVTGIIVPQKRIMSDVTAQKFNIDRPRDAETYYQDLQRMAGERYKKRMEEKQRLIQQEVKHFQVFSKYFQKPGHGAPHTKGNARRKFSNNAIMAQEQVGTTIPAVSEKATLLSALNLVQDSKYLKKKGKLQSHVQQAGNSAPEASSMVSPICEECPLKKLKPEHARRTASLPLHLNTHSKHSEKDPRQLLEFLEVDSSEKVLDRVQPFPYSVVAPWAVDAQTN